MTWFRSLAEENDAKFLQALKDSGVTVTDPGDAERQKFREAAQVGYWNEFFGKFPDTKPVAEKVLAVQ
jgi:TRAP-type C4-dicarboxylate transport system substrate-binding protein